MDMVRGRVAGRPIESTTSPDTTEVQRWLDGAEALLLGALRNAGCNIPEAGTEGGLQIAEWVVDYAEGHVRTAWVAGIDQDNDGQQMIENFRKMVLEDIPGSGSMYCGMLNGGTVSDEGRRFRSWITDNPDGENRSDGDFTPEFKRDEQW
jgi:hypothetical protein